VTINNLMRVSAASFESILGSQRVCFDEHTRQRYARSTGIRGTLPAGVLFPNSTGDVVQILKAASALRVSVHPISCGKNWGYSDACAPFDGQVIVDLSRMNAICELNLEQAYVVVEPGVTQGQLAECLATRKTGLWMDATGAGPSASLIGNIVDRGFGHTRYGDHFQSCCGLEVVLADGTTLDTGFGHFNGAKGNRIFKYGVGPVLDGLFSQSNLGIVTRAGIYLMPEPEDFCAYFLRAERDSDLEWLVRKLAALKLHGVLQTAVHIANDLRVISGRMTYPWERAGGNVPLPDSLTAKLRREHGVGAWNGAGSISGPKEVVAAIRAKLQRDLKGARITFVSSRSLSVWRRFQKILRTTEIGRSLKGKIELGEALFHTLQGKPNNGAIPGTWWRVRSLKDPKANDPLDNDAGLLWISPVLAADPAQARELLQVMNPIYSKHGFDTLVTFTLLTERAMVCVSNIAFDRTDVGECARARDCHDELMNSLITRGYIPYRAGPASYKYLAFEASPFWRVAARLKQALDPTGIISPGRYIPDMDRATGKGEERQL
jgi:4-cresol dehydrogenase (hydroxylating) flavoprotein subunit